MPKNLDVEKPRDSGAIKELETAKALLAEGLVRNAAGRPSRHLKASISYLALKNAALLAEKYRGYKQAGEDSRTVPRMGSRSSAHRQTTGNGHIAERDGL